MSFGVVLKFSRKWRCKKALGLCLCPRGLQRIISRSLRLMSEARVRHAVGSRNSKHALLTSGEKRFARRHHSPSPPAQRQRQSCCQRRTEHVHPLRCSFVLTPRLPRAVCVAICVVQIARPSLRCQASDIPPWHLSPG